MAAHPWLVLGVALLLSAATLPSVYDFASGTLRVRYDPSANRLLPRDDEAGDFYRFTRRLFGNDETLIVGLHADDVFRAEPLGSLMRIGARIAALPGVHHVSSLATVTVPRASEEDDDELRLGPLLARLPTNDRERVALRREALANPLLAGRVVSRDGRALALIVEFEDFSDREFFQRDYDGEIARIAREEARGVEVRLTGSPHLKLAVSEATASALRARLALVFALAFAALTVGFGTARGMLLPLVTVALAQLWTFALLGALDRPLNGVTATVPLLLAILGLIYSVHVISTYYDELRAAPERAPADSMVRALRRIALPMLLGALTTAVSLLAAAVTPVGALRSFAWLTLVGILVAFGAAVTVTPALLLAFGRPAGFARGPEPAAPDAFARFAAATTRMLLRRRRALIWAFIAFLAASLGAATRVRISTDVPRALPADSTTRLDFDAMNRRLEGATDLRVVVEARQGTLTAPENLLELARLEEWLEKRPEVGGVTSVTDWIALLNRAAQGVAAEASVLPADPALTEQLLRLGRGDEQNALVDASWQRANLAVRTTAVATGELRALAGAIEARLAELPPRLHGRVTGQALAFQRVSDRLVAAQLESLVLALGVAYVILSLLFLSPRAGLRALAPSLVVVAFCFGFLGAADQPLSLATSAVPPIALGFALNATIHYFARFAGEARRLADEEAATGRALAAVGRPVTISALALCLAFGALATANLGDLRWLGATAAAALAVAWLGAFVLLPALCAELDVVTLWDTLSLDLGEAPQRSIPLLRDLSTAQCRIVAQHGTLRNVPAGQPLLRSGDEGREMFLVIDGVLEASIDTPAGPEVVGRFGRGDLVGEVGFYTRKHSAQLDVVERARLLRLTERGLARLERRSPRIAAVLFRNLSRILAGRVADTTRRLR